jgi:Glycosyl hydrolase catalytic core
MRNARVGVIAVFACALLFSQGVLAAENAVKVVTPKKGVAAAKFGPDKIATADASWYYDWRNTPNSGTAPAGTTIEYVPMLSNAGAVTTQNIAALTTAKNNGTYKYLLGFNEPDLGSQANMTVAQAISLWPQLMSTGLTLGSPAPSWPNAWFDTFMTQAAAKNYRIDFICLHYYAPPNAATSVSDLKTFLTNAYNKYKKPIWLTEFGAPDCKTLLWCGSNAAALTQAQVDAFVSQVIAMLEDLACVQRYAWFVDASQAGFELSAVFNGSGALTPTGIDLRDAHGTASVQTYGPASIRPAASPLVYIRADKKIACILPADQIAYRLSLYTVAGRLVATCAGIGSGETAMNLVPTKLTRGTFISKLEYGGNTRQAKVVVE